MSSLIPITGADRARPMHRTVASMALAGYVVPPPIGRFAGFGADGRLLATEAEIVQLLRLEALTAGQIDRVEQLDDWMAFTPARTLVGAEAKLRRILCGRIGMLAPGSIPRLNGADEAALRDVLRLIGPGR